MNSKQLNRILLISLALLVLGLFGGTYLINGNLQKRSESVVKKRAEVYKLEQEQNSLVRAKKDVQTYRPLAQIAKNIVPQDKDQAQTVREIVGIAERNGISLGSITFPTSTLGQAAVKSTKGAKPAAGSGTSNNSALSQLVPVSDIPGVYSLQIIVTSDTDSPVSYSKFLSFLDALEHNRRTALVSSISINPDEDNPNNVAFTLTLDEYIKP